MNEIIQEFIHNIMEQQEKIIKEIAEQGHKYLVIKKYITYEGNKAKCNYQYHGFDSSLDLNILEEKGYEVFDLTKVIEYLNNKRGE